MFLLIDELAETDHVGSKDGGEANGWSFGETSEAQGRYVALLIARAGEGCVAVGISLDRVVCRTLLQCQSAA
jgi:hypothetical protein